MIIEPLVDVPLEKDLPLPPYKRYALLEEQQTTCSCVSCGNRLLVFDTFSPKEMVITMTLDEGGREVAMVCIGRRCNASLGSR